MFLENSACRPGYDPRIFFRQAGFLTHWLLVATGRELVGVHDAAGEARADKGVEPHDERDEPKYPQDPHRHTSYEGREDKGRAVDPHDEEHGESQNRSECRVKQAQQHRDRQEGGDGLGAPDDVVVRHVEVAREAGHVVCRRRVGGIGRDDEQSQGQACTCVRRSSESVARQCEQSQPGRGGSWQSRESRRELTAETRAKLRVRSMVRFDSRITEQSLRGWYIICLHEPTTVPV